MIEPTSGMTPADRLAAAQGCAFDPAAADRVLAFIEKFILVPNAKGKASPVVLLAWQRQMVHDIFGWRTADGTRRFRSGYVSLAKKNGKTFLLAVILLAMVVCESGDAAECYSVATSRDQAGMIYREAKRLIRASPELKAILTCVDSTKQITFEKRNCFYRALASESASAEGRNAALVIYDELHAAGDRELFDALRYSGAARRDSLFLSITTAGTDLNSICGEQYSYARKVMAGEIPDITFLARIYEAGEKDDWSSEETWRKANPALGETLSLDEFRKDFEEARSSPAKENAFRRYRLNQWVAAESRFIPAHAWQGCAGTYSERDLLGLPCYLGVDLSISTDITAVVAIFPIEDAAFRTLCRFYLPKATIAAMRGKLPYDVWVRGGFITPIDGNVIDYDAVRKDIREFGKLFSIRGIGIDPYNAQNFETQLSADGFKVCKVPQNMGTMSPLTKEYERQILRQKLRHNNNPVLTWMAGCATVKTDSEGNIKPTKPDRKSSNKIDGIIAQIMALGLAMNEQRTANNPASKSVYEERGLLAIGADDE